jgi:hypothetical protein
MFNKPFIIIIVIKTKQIKIKNKLIKFKILNHI